MAIPPWVQAQIEAGVAAAELQVWRERLVYLLDERLGQVEAMELVRQDALFRSWLERHVLTDEGER